CCAKVRLIAFQHVFPYLFSTMKPKKNPAKVLSRRTLCQHHESFLHDLRKRKPETRGTYERALREFFRWLEKEQKFTASADGVERYKSHLTKKRKLSPVSISTYLTALRVFFRFLVHNGILREDPAAHVKGGKRPQTHSRETLTAVQIASLLESVGRSDERGFRDYAVLKAMAVCGLSEIELVRSNIEDLKSVDGIAVMYVQPKGSITKETIIVLPPDVQTALSEYLTYRKDADGNEPLFMSAGNRTRGKRMTTRGLRERVNLYLEKSNIKNGKLRRITPFSLRHSAATLLAAQGATIEELQARFHIATAATARLYMRSPEESTTNESTK
ncbi:MAG: tyrosine-type recombinase/integrase, partial [Ignavibacteriales bacterium]|nr:tyrosine-type recombinase/integrase [Ignavibacteriales bacterium]